MFDGEIEPVEDVEAVVALLDDATANRIAAGEVVERPSSVVKELVENALDAGATRIEVELYDGGKSKIVVRDNGCGMGRTDAVLSLQRHATSKIRTAGDLFAIRTLGFRGEALPSIASVSDFTLLTKRPKDEAATGVSVRGGQVERVEDAAAPDGTQITVENLFFAVPARLKFLKTNQTELNHVTEFLQRLILCYYQTSFRLTHDDHEMIAYPGSDDPLQALAEVWGRDTARAMVPLRFESPALTVHGWVSKPSVSKATRSAQAFFVNGRSVRSRTVQNAFDRAFANLMTTDRHPVATLFLEVDPTLVDVNVHPAKTEVRFTRDGDVYSAVHHAVESALLTGGLVPEVTVQTSLDIASPQREVQHNLPRRPSLSSYVDLASLPNPPFGVDPTSSARREGEIPPFPRPDEVGNRPREGAGGWVPEQETDREGAGGSADPPVIGGQGVIQNSYLGFDGYRIGRLRVIGQARNTYIVCETDDAILFVDQHIAHERVLYEQLMNGFTEGAERWGVVAQHLALPQTLELSAQESKVVSERLDALSRAGFVLDRFGGNTFVVRAVPASLADKAYLETLKQIVEELTFSSLSRKLLVPHEDALIMASCKLAVKKGDPLTYEEMTRLLVELAAMKNPFTCPHGRPILLALPHAETDRKFHRTGPH